MVGVSKEEFDVGIGGVLEVVRVPDFEGLPKRITQTPLF